MKTSILILSLCLSADAQTLTHWATARARVLANGGNARILCIGDSTTRGVGASTATAFPAALAGFLTNSGIPANFNSWYGGSDATMQDTRVNIGGWTFSAAVSMGGRLMTASGASAALTFTPTGSVDTFVFRYIQSSGNGTFSYQVDSGSTTNVNAAGATAVINITVSGLSLASHTIKFNYVSGGNVYIIGNEAWNSASSSVDVINAGWGGSKPVDWDTNTGAPYDPLSMISVIAPDLIFVDLGINNWSTGGSVPTYSSGMQTLLTAAISYGGADVVIVTPIPSNISFASQAVQQSFVTEMISLGSTNSLRVIDEFARIGTWYAAGELNQNNDGQHGNAAGYAAFSTMLNGVLTTNSFGSSLVKGTLVKGTVK